MRFDVKKTSDCTWSVDTFLKFSYYERSMLSAMYGLREVPSEGFQRVGVPAFFCQLEDVYRHIQENEPNGYSLFKQMNY